jgi:hypothetical protein
VLGLTVEPAEESQTQAKGILGHAKEFGHLLIGIGARPSRRHLHDTRGQSALTKVIENNIRTTRRVEYL